MKPENKAELWDFAKEIAYNILKFNEGLYKSKNSTFKASVINEIIYNDKMISTPTRLAHKANVIEINKHIFVKLDNPLRIIAVLWCAFKQGTDAGQSFNEDLEADKRAVDLILENDYDFEKGKLALQWAAIINSNKHTSKNYRSQRINGFFKYYYKKIDRPMPASQ